MRTLNSFKEINCMKPTLFLILTLVFLSSCTSYRYLTLSGVNFTKNEKRELVSENDTLKVQYNFSDYQGRIGIRIYNKTNEPIEIDWRKSALILEGKAFSYFVPNAILSATLEKDTLAFQNTIGRSGSSVHLASVNGSVAINEPTQFIPPASGIFKIPLALPLEGFRNLRVQTSEKVTMNGYNGSRLSYDKIEFTRSASPMHLRSYLTLRIGSLGAQKEFIIDHIFYVSEIWESNSGPASFPQNFLNRSDMFFLAGKFEK
jgi:hypothetical protein